MHFYEWSFVFWLKLIEISLKFVPKGPIDNNIALVQIMAWRRIGDKPLLEPMMTRFTDTYMRHQGRWVNQELRACFLSLAQSKLRLCSANHRPGYWSNLPCDWPSTAWAYSEQETENRPWAKKIEYLQLAGTMSATLRIFIRIYVFPITNVCPV